MARRNFTPKDLATAVLFKLKGAKINYPEPPVEVLNTLFENLFFASMKTEEGQFIRVTITLIDPEGPLEMAPQRVIANSCNCIKFDERIDFTVKNLVKLSKAADPWSSSLAVYYNSKNELEIWGMIDQALHYQSFLNYETEDEPEQPGLFQATVSGIGCLDVIFDYELIATLKQHVLIGSYIDVFSHGVISEKISFNSNPIITELKKYIKGNYPKEENNFWEEEVQEYINASVSRILLRIQGYQHGGAILITNDYESDLDIKYKITYDRLALSIINLAKLNIENTVSSTVITDKYIKPKKRMIPREVYLDENVSEFEMQETKDELKGVVRYIASLSCVDGLVVISPELKVKGFGAVIKPTVYPNEVFVSKTAVVDQSKLVLFDVHHFGTRHRSMFSYCWNHPGSIGFVVSQDGDIRAIMRVEDKLIMWENIKVQQFIRSEKLKRFMIKKRLTQGPAINPETNSLIL